MVSATSFRCWRDAALLGLLSSSFSTVVSQLLAARIGRDALVDWMVVAAIPGRSAMLQTEPTWLTTVIGIAFHQLADFSWAVFFFGILGRFTCPLSARQLALLAAPWAILTSGLEWLFLVPVFPFFQPIFPLEQVYWIGFLVHFSSAAVYPVFPLLRRLLGRRPAAADTRLAKAWLAMLAIGGICAAGLAALGQAGYEYPWVGRSAELDQAYIRRMFAHHAQGIELALLAEKQAQDPDLRALARLMAAEQRGENRILGHWSWSWFGMPVPDCTNGERAGMPGMLRQDQIADLAGKSGTAFDQAFIRAMSFHHSGAVAMADEELRSDGDPRLRIMAHGIRHAQQGEIDLMRKHQGFYAVGKAIANMTGVRYAPDLDAIDAREIRGR